MNKHFPCKTKCDVSRQIKSPQKAGFALIATIAVMALMAVTALAMLSLSTVEVRSSNHGDAMSEARANARMALMIAIGELQKAAGPDTRVTATANIDDDAVVGKKHWVGVWSSADIDGSGDIDGVGDGVADGNFIGWLASSPPSDSNIVSNGTSEAAAYSKITKAIDSDDMDSATLFGKGNSVDSENKVIVPKVIIERDNSEPAGSYAWWISDEGVKARVNLARRRDLTQSPEDNESVIAQQSMQRFALEAMTDYSQSEYSEDTQKIITTATIAVADSNSPSLLSTANENSHDLTTYSIGLNTTTSDQRALTNSDPEMIGKTINGGLKMDLSLLFEKDDNDFKNVPIVNYTTTSDDLYQSAPLVGDVGLVFTIPNIPNSSSEDGLVFGPTWELLRDYYRLYKEVSDPTGNPTLEARANYPNHSDIGHWSGTASGQGNSWFGAVEPYDSYRNATHSRDNWLVNGVPDNHPITRLTKASYAPYINRSIVQFTAKSGNSPLSADTGEAISGNESKIDFYVQPLVYLHNPYNISITSNTLHYQLGATYIYAVIQSSECPSPKMEYTSAELASTSFTRCRTPETVFEIAPTTFAPGEIKVFGVDGIQNYGTTNKLTPITDFSYNPNNSGTLMPQNHQTWGGKENLADKDFEDRSGGSGRSTSGNMLLNAIPQGASIKLAYNWNRNLWQDLYIEPSDGASSPLTDYDCLWSSNASDYTQLSTGIIDRSPTLWNGKNNRLNSNGGKHWTDVFNAMDFSPVSHFSTMKAVGIIDYFVRPTDYSIQSFTPHTFYSQGYPSFVVNNPRSPNDSGDTGRGDPQKVGSMGSAPMIHVHSDCLAAQSPGDYIFPVLVNGGDYGTWGSNNDSSGQRYCVVHEIPTAPIHSIANLTHANLTTRSDQPSLAIGNSFINPLISDPSKTWEVSRSGTQVNYDYSYYMNRTLWDHYYFSTLSETTSRGMQQQIEELYDDGTPLNNPRSIALDTQTRDEAIANLKTSKAENFQLSAAYLTTKGAFNLNSTSVEAWKSILSGFKNQQIARLENDTISEVTTDSAAILRSSLPNSEGVQSPTGDGDNDWSAFLKLDDKEIDTLANAIVEEIKRRAKLRGNGSISATPTLTLSDYINRAPSSNDEQSRNHGLLQAAIINTQTNDDYTGDIFDHNLLDNYFNATDTQRRQQVLYNSSFDIGAAMGIKNSASSPTHLLQSDILQALGNAITVRSDTFIIRAYGESKDELGNTLAEAWCEAVVQRTPEPITPLGRTGILKWTPDDSSTTQNYGRRFKITQFKWLSKEEV